MTRAEIDQAVLRALLKVAPEADPQTLEPGVPLRDQLDLDSMDLLRVVLAIHEELGVDIPEEDYPKLGSLAACSEYLERRLR
ncbi:MAG: acyl carrier protein [Myxococcaceae bacterium]